MAVVVRFVELK